MENLQETENGLVRLIRNRWKLPAQDMKEYSPLTLAYIGDAIFDLIIRTYLVEQGNTQVNKLHKRASTIVKATAQKKLFFAINQELTPEETAVYKRGRNAKSVTTAKNASVGDYRVATGLEALFGYLYLTEQYERILELVYLGMTRMEQGIPEQTKEDRRNQTETGEGREE